MGARNGDLLKMAISREILGLEARKGCQSVLYTPCITYSEKEKRKEREKKRRIYDCVQLYATYRYVSGCTGY